MTSVTLFSIFGAVLLVLFGMRYAGEGLQKAAGARLRAFLMNAGKNRVKGMAFGAAITALLQSSSATTVMLVGFVGAGVVGLSETMAMILGADIGTTITVQLLAFRIYDHAIAVIGIGILLKFVSKKGIYQEAGQAIMGFGFVFLGLKVLLDTMGPATDDPLLSGFMVSLSKDPLAGIIVSALLTALFQSSAATLGVAITLAHSGLLTLDAAVPIVLGANVGTCVSALVSAMGAGINAKRVALAHILYKVAGVVIVLPLLGPFTELSGMASADLARQIAYAHTFFNIGIAIIFLPFTTPFTGLIQRLLPERERAAEKGAKYLDPIVLATPSLALVQASRETLRCAETVGNMLKDSMRVFVSDDAHLLEKIEEKDDEVDLLDREVKLYLTKLARESLSEAQAKRELEIMLFSDNLENIGDVIDKNLMELARKKIRGNYMFSEEGLSEISALHEKVVESFELGVAAFAGSDRELAHRLLGQKARVSELERELRQAHISRLHKGLRESIDTSAIHLDVLTNLKRINSYVTNIAYPILEKGRD